MARGQHNAVISADRIDGRVVPNSDHICCTAQALNNLGLHSSITSEHNADTKNIVPAKLGACRKSMGFVGRPLLHEQFDLGVHLLGCWPASDELDPHSTNY